MRVIGYNDPRKLNEIDDWKELREYDHFCISQTLVQGLSREFGRTVRSSNFVCMLLHRIYLLLPVIKGWIRRMVEPSMTKNRG